MKSHGLLEDDDIFAAIDRMKKRKAVTARAPLPERKRVIKEIFHAPPQITQEERAAYKAREKALDRKTPKSTIPRRTSALPASKNKK